jgi:hypothetical protein
VHFFGQTGDYLSVYHKISQVHLEPLNREHQGTRFQKKRFARSQGVAGFLVARSPKTKASLNKDATNEN